MASEAHNPLSEKQVMAIAVCMLSIAHVDGVRPEETALIQKFYEESCSASMPAFSAVKFSDEELASHLKAIQGEKDFAEQLILMCLMAGYADGKLTTAELNRVRAIAAQVNVSTTDVDKLIVQVKDTLISALSHLPEPESVAALRQAM
jgi:hypothetical protein